MSRVGQFLRWLFGRRFFRSLGDGVATALAAVLIPLLVPSACGITGEAVSKPEKVGVQQVGLINVIWQEPDQVPEPRTEPPPPGAGIQIPLPGGQALGFERVCQDDGREIGRLRLAVFSREYRWKCGSATEVISPDGVDFSRDVLSAPGLQSYLEADEIVAAGTASCDTDDDIAQDCLAYQRALTLQSWVRRVRVTPGQSRSLDDLHTLNLGQYRAARGAPCNLNKCEDTGSQRAVILIGIRGRRTERLEDCLKDILKNDPEPILRLNGENGYPRFDFDQPMPVGECREAEL